MRPTKEINAPFKEVSRSEAAASLQGIARGFRLTFGSIGVERKVDDQSKSNMLQGLTVQQQEQMRLTKKLFAKHPALKKLSSAKSRLKRLFEDKTFPFPEDSVRIFLSEHHKNTENMSTKELDEHHGKQVSQFREYMQSAIEKHHTTAVTELQAVWDDVIEKAKEKLQDQFVEANYPSKEDLPNLIYCRFEPYNVELSRDWKFLSPTERERELAVVRQKFEAAVAKQEEFVTTLLSDAVDQMLSSVSDFHTSKTRAFKSSVVERVFKALDEFKDKTVRYGILKDSAVEDIFNRVRAVMNPAGRGADQSGNVAGKLRSNSAYRADMISKISSIGTSLKTLIETGQVRRKLAKL